MYLQDKSGLVAQPPPLGGSRDKAVIFSTGEAKHTQRCTNPHPPSLTPTTGHLQAEDSSVTVFYSSGQYTISLLDHVRVRVKVESSHAHGLSLKMDLLSCITIEPQQSVSSQKTHKKEVNRKSPFNYYL